MGTASIDVVRAFCEALSKSPESARAAFLHWFTPETVWEHVGHVTTRGIKEALAMIEGLNQDIGITRVQLEILAIAADGDRVLTERVDRMFGQDGEIVAEPRVMGIFEVTGNHITAWRDYFDAGDDITQRRSVG